MGKRHDSIAVKQVIRFEWMQKVANLLLAGLDEKCVRQELHEFLSKNNEDRLASEQSAQTRTFAVNNLMRIWVSPDQDLRPFRDASLEFLRVHPAMALAVHWGMVSAAYPFWFNVALHTGRLLALQDQVTQMQIINRLKEQYGDRQTVSRYGRFVIRSFVSWSVLSDSDLKGSYKKSAVVRISDPSLVSLLCESAMLAANKDMLQLGVVLNSPAFFPFNLSTVSGGSLSFRRNSLKLVQHGPDHEFVARSDT